MDLVKLTFNCREFEVQEQDRNGTAFLHTESFILNALTSAAMAPG